MFFFLSFLDSHTLRACQVLMVNIGTHGFSVYSRILEQKQTESSFHFVCLHSTVEGHQGEGESHMM